MAKVIILSGPVQSGKTTTLMEWVEERNDVVGFLCPDINQVRHLYMIESGSLHPFEANGVHNEPTIQIGRFTFYTSGFKTVKSWLSKSAESDARWIIIDEIGKLELAGEGFEPELSRFIDSVRRNVYNPTLIIVVREQLLNQVIDKYQLHDAVKSDILNFGNVILTS